MPTDAIEPLGKRYFRTRDGLAKAIAALVELGAETGIEPGIVTLLKGLLADLAAPFLVVAIGEDEAGKSTLLQALFDESCHRDGILTATERIACSRNGSEVPNLDIPGENAEPFGSNGSPRDFHLVEIPAASAGEASQQQLMTQLLLRAELVIIVFSVRKLWGEAPWDCLDRLRREWRGETLLVLQQCDRRSEDEVAAILDHLQTKARLRFAKRFRFFAVSAEKAILANAPGEDRAKLRRESGIESLEQYVSGTVESSVSRLATLTRARRTASEAAETIKERLDSISHFVRADDELLSRLESACATRKERILKKSEPLFEDLDRGFLAAGTKAKKLLSPHRRLASTLLPRRRAVEEIEVRIRDFTARAARRSAGPAAQAVQDDIDDLSQDVAKELEDRYRLKRGDAIETTRPDWSAAQRRIEEAVEEATGAALRDLKLGDALWGLFLRRALIVWGWLAASVLCASTGAILTIQARGFPEMGPGMVLELFANVILTMLERGPWNALAFTGASLFLFTAAYFAIRPRRQERALCDAILDRRRENLAKAQREAFTEQTEALYAECAASFEPLREACRKYRERLGPQERKLREAQAILAELERILTPVEKAIASRVG